MKCRTGRPLTFNCPGTIKGWWTRCTYRTYWFAACLHSCLFNLLTYLLWSSASTVVNVAADNNNGEGGIEDVRKRSPERLEGSPADISSISSNSFFSNKRARSEPGRPRGAPFVQPQQQQMKLCGRDVNDPIANQCMDIAVANFVHSNCLSFSLTKRPKFLKVIAEAKNVGTKYLPPNQNQMSGHFLMGSTSLIMMRWWGPHSLSQESLVLQFMVTVQQSQTPPLLTFWQLALTIHPRCLRLLIVPAKWQLGVKKMRPTLPVLWGHYNSNWSACKHQTSETLGCCWFSSVWWWQQCLAIRQNPCQTSSMHYRLSWGGACYLSFLQRCFLIGKEFFILLYTIIILLTHSIPNSQLQIEEYKDLSNFCKGCRNIWGYVRHGPHAMFKHYKKIHNNGIFSGFTKPSECRIVGEQIALTHLLGLRDALKSTINSKEFMDLNNFKPETFVWIMTTSGCTFLWCVVLCMLLCLCCVYIINKFQAWKNSTIMFYRQIGCYSGGCLMQRSEYWCSAAMVRITPWPIQMNMSLMKKPLIIAAMMTKNRTLMMMTIV